jgi:hypothetical protein
LGSELAQQLDPEQEVSPDANASILDKKRADKLLFFCEFRFTFIPTATAIANTAIPPNMYFFISL